MKLLAYMVFPEPAASFDAAMSDDRIAYLVFAASARAARLLFCRGVPWAEDLEYDHSCYIDVNARRLPEYDKYAADTDWATYIDERLGWVPAEDMLYAIGFYVREGEQ